MHVFLLQCRKRRQGKIRKQTKAQNQATKGKKSVESSASPVVQQQQHGVMNPTGTYPESSEGPSAPLT